MKTIALLPGLFVFLKLAALSPGAVLAVNTEADEADTPAGAALSLREAVRDAASGDVIQFAAALSGRALSLTRGEMAVTGRAITVDGSTLANGLTLTANLASRHFNVSATGTLTLTGLMLAKGQGGAVLNAGTTTLTNCIVRECRMGGIHNTGTFTATGTKFLFNEAEHGTHGTSGANIYTTDPFTYPPPNPGGNATGGADGGAIRSTGTLTIANCWFHGNKGGTGGYGGLGGRVYYQQNVLVNGPFGLGGYGGGGGAIWQSGPCTISGSTFSENQAGEGGGEGDAQGRQVSGGRGGAIYYAGGASPAVLTNCTFTGNSVSIGATAGTWTWQQQSALRLEGGGALYGESGTLRLVHVTVAGNLNVMGHYSTNFGGYAPVVARSAGVLSSGLVEVANSIIAQNSRQMNYGVSPTWEVADFAGPMGSFDFQEINLLGTPGDPDTLTYPGSPLTGTFAQPKDPELGDLVYQGGATPVRVPLASSPAREQGLGPLAGAATDQRGLTRNLPVDLGAVETQMIGETAGLRAQTLTFTQPGQQYYTGTNVNVNLVAVASSGLAPVFSVVAGPATVTGSTLTITGRGTVHVKASQPGNSTWAAADAVTWPVSVTKLQQTITFSSATLYYRGVNLTRTLSATASSGLPVTMAFLSGPGSLAGGILTATGPGTILVRADQVGNASYEPAPAVTATFTVQWDQPVVTGASFTRAAGVQFSEQAAALYSPDSFGASGLPPGLSIDPATGLVSGTPSSPGDYNASIIATNASGTGSAQWQFSITRPAPVAGETIVTTLTDELDSPAGALISLREAIRDTASGGTIRFHASLSGGTAVIPIGVLAAGGKELTITAEDLPGGLKISGSQTTRLFSLAKYDLFHLRRLELMHGRSTSGANGFQGVDAPLGYDISASSGGPGEPGGNGGAIHNLGTLNLWRCTFRGNQTGNGGNGGRAGRVGGLTYSTYGGRGGDGGQGGAIFNAAGAALVADECFFQENSGGTGGTGGSLLQTSYSAGGQGGSGGDGGAIASAGSLTLRDCTFSANLSGTGGLGGEGPHSYPSHGRPGSGGAVSASAATLLNCTFHGNGTPPARAYAYTGNPNELFWETFTHRPGTGGALSVQTGKAIHCTFAANTVPLQTFTPSQLAVVGGKGGGLSAGSAFTLENCLVAGNTAPFPDNSDLDGTPALTGANLFSIRGTTAGPLNGTVAAPLDAKLLPLANYGGFTPTLPLDRFSPSRNAAITTADTPTLDQRGLPRSQGLSADLGAFEWDEAHYLALARPDFHVRQQGAAASMHWQTQAGYLYTLLESTTLLPPWQPSSLTITVDANGAASCPLPITDSRHFYLLGISIAP
jgi:hypothetical protein